MADEQPFKLVRSGLSPTGLAILILASLALLCGLAIGNGTLIALGSIVILLLCIAIIPGRKAANSLNFDLTLPQRTQADRPFPLLLKIRNNSKYLLTPPVHASIIFPDAPALNFDVEALAPQHDSFLRLRSRKLCRGVHSQWSILVESGFPLGLFQFRYRCVLSRSITVIPRPLDSDEAEAFGNDQFGDPMMLTGKFGAEEEFVSLRPYRHGDSLRRIHWPTSNRGRGLTIREVEFPGQLPSHITLVFHSVNSGKLIRPDRFERALSKLTGLIETLVKNNRTVEIRADFAQYHPHQIKQTHQLRKYLDSLAEVSRHRNSSAVKLEQILEQIPDSHHVIILTDN